MSHYPSRKEVFMLVGFILSVIAGVVANIISKWLDKNCKDR